MLERQDRPPQIIVRIPGRWRDRADFASSLPTGYRLRGDRLVLPDGSAIEFEALPRDAEFVDIFGVACRLDMSRRTRRDLSRYTVNACVAGVGGSIDNARRMLTVTADIVRAGGAGVFLDGSLLAHPREVWLEIAANEDLEAVVPALVSLIANNDEMWSLGMHALGLRDAVIVRGTDREKDFDVLVSFLHFLATTNPALTDGDYFHAEEHIVKVDGEPSTHFAESSPAHNPYGRWRLTRPGNQDSSGGG